MLATVEVAPSSDPVGAVIWLHGLGADGHDFAPMVPELRLDGVLPLRFVFPHAPVRPVTLNGGMRMRAWFDLFELSATPRVDADGIRAARVDVEALVDRERERGIEDSAIVVGGFSQGGALALMTALGRKEPLAGIVGLSTWLPKGIAEIADAQRATPLLLAHGTADPIVPVAAGRATRASLEEAGCAVEWHEYPMAHQVCAEEIADLRAFLLRAFGVGQRSIE